MTTSFALRAGRLFDGRDVSEQATVVVDDGTISSTAAGPSEDALDLGDDVTLLPGLVDGHVHLCLDASLDLVGGMAVDDVALLARMHDAAHAMLSVGITTVRDLGDRAFLATHVRTPLTVLSAGPPLTTKGGHCWFLGGEVEGTTDLLRAVEQRAEAGCSVVKVMVSGGNITPGSTPFDSQFRAPELKQVVAEAHRLGLQTAAHAHAQGSIVEALDAGFDTLEHVTFMHPEALPPDQALLRRVVDSGVVVSTTPGALPGFGPPPHLAAQLASVVESMTRLRALGPRIAIGSDGGVSPGKPHHLLPHLVGWLVGLGWAPRDVLVGMTSAAADAIGLGGRKGVIVPGADADLLAVRGNPLEDPAAMHDVVGVWARGVRVR